MGEESDDDLSNIVITFISIAFLVSAIFTALYTYFLLPVLLTSSPSVSFGPQDDENEQENEEGSEESTKTKRFLWRPRSKFWLKQLSVFVTCTLSILKYLVSNWIELSYINWVHLFAIVSVCTILFMDNDVSSVSQHKVTITIAKQRSWLPIYAFNFVYSIVSAYQEGGEYLTMPIAVTSSAALFFALMYTFFNPDLPQYYRPTEEYTSGLLSYLSFSYLNKLLIQPGVRKDALDMNDVPNFVDEDSAEVVNKKIAYLMRKRLNVASNVNVFSKGVFSSSAFMSSIFEVVWCEWLGQGCFQFIGSVALYMAPLALQRILLRVSSNGTDDDEGKCVIPISVTAAMIMLFLGPALKSIGDGQNYVRGRHIGVRVKGALIGSIYKKSLTVDLSASKESVGKLNNLISVDVSEIQSFCCYSHYMWSTVVELSTATTLLFIVVGKAAAVGLVVMFLSLVIAALIGRKEQVLQDSVLSSKDARMGLLNEVLNSVKIIKYYAWEMKFMDKVNAAREAELKNLLSYSLWHAFLSILWAVVPALISAAVFITHTFILGEPLTPAMGFSCLTIFNLLQFPLLLFPEMVNMLVRAGVSMKRIIAYLETEDVRGIPSLTNSSNNNSGSGSSGYYSSPLRKGTNISTMHGSVSLRDVTMGWNKTLNDSETTTESDSSSSGGCGDLSLCSRSCAVLSRSFSIYGRKKSARNKNNYSKLTSSIATKQSSTKDRSPLLRKYPNSEDTDIEMSEKKSTMLQQRILVDESPSGSQDVEGASASTFAGKVVVSNLTCQLRAGSLTVIVGMTGAGKSSFLQGVLLGEGQLLSGQSSISGSVSYVSQTAWIQNATLRDNVLFGNKFIESRYEAVLFACALDTDLKLLPLGDMTEIGEKGVNLSGGQQQRVSLARAAYAFSDVVLLDDPLSAVDSHVGEHIFKHLILGFLSGRTRILVTHNLALCVPRADMVVCLSSESSGDQQGNSILLCCPPRDIPHVIKRLYTNTVGATADDGRDSSSATTNSAGNTKSKFLEGLENAVTTAAAVSEEEVKQFDDVSDNFKTPEFTTTKKMLASSSVANHSYPSLEYLSKHKQQQQQVQVGLNSSSGGSSSGSVGTTEGGGGIVTLESKAEGDISLEVYWYYLKAAGGILSVFGLLFAGVWVSFSWFAQSYSLGKWMEEMEISNSPNGRGFSQYIGCACSVLLACSFRSVFQIGSALVAARKIHEQLLKSTLLASCAWFDSTPIGRIINRFSQDITTIDSSTMVYLVDFLDCLLGTCQILFIISWCFPLLLVSLLPVVIFTAWVAYQYLRVSRELKRLESVKKSPVFVLFSETLLGLPVVRAFRKEEFFFKLCCEKVDEMNRCHLYLWICNRWLNFRMQILGALVAGVVGIVVVMEAKTIGSTAAGIVLIYSLSFQENLTFLTRMHAECQMAMNSVERVREYSELEPERYGQDIIANDSSASSVSPHTHTHTSACNSCCGKVTRVFDKGQGTPSFKAVTMDDLTLDAIESGSAHNALISSKVYVPQNWPAAGLIEFKGISLKYHSSSQPVLHKVSFKIPSRKKIGVVGRTGAGKSSLIAALFRLVEPIEGSLLIDDINVLDIPLHTLRSKIAIVPQDPTLFKGTVRFNLDPFNQHSDSEIWAALSSVHMADHVRAMESDTSSSGSSGSSSVSSDGSGDYSADNEFKKSELALKLVAEKGANFSVGQRQLLCMARAILRKAPVLVLDECTASVDHETDALIQDTVRRELSQCTVLCIAHRLHTIAYYDLVMVLDKGKVVEFSDPFTLMSTESSLFRGLCQSSGDFDELLSTARAVAQVYVGRDKASNNPLGSVAFQQYNTIQYGQCVSKAEDPRKGMISLYFKSLPSKNEQCIASWRELLQ